MPPSISTEKRRGRITSCLRRKLCDHCGRSPDSFTSFDPLGPKYREILSDVAETFNGKRLKNYGPMNPDSSFDQAVEFLMTVIQH